MIAAVAIAFTLVIFGAAFACERRCTVPARRHRRAKSYTPPLGRRRT